jgi:ribonuclease G
MSKELVISATPHETRVAILEDGHLCEIYVEREKEFALVGSIYKGRVTRVLPGMQSAFVDIGLDSDAFLYVSDFLENLEEYDSVVSAVETKVQRMEEEGGRVFSAQNGAPAAVEPPEVISSEPAAVAAPPTQDAPAPPEPASASAYSHPSPPASTPFGSRERGGYGRGRGGRGRRGRWDRRDDRGRRGRREFPPSKYASPHAPSYQPPTGTEDLEPIILPGESLAKYRDRMPAAPSDEPVTVPVSPVSPEVDSQVAERVESEAGGWADAVERPVEAIPAPVAEPAPSAKQPGVLAFTPPGIPTLVEGGAAFAPAAEAVSEPPVVTGPDKEVAVTSEAVHEADSVAAPAARSAFEPAAPTVESAGESQPEGAAAGTEESAPQDVIEPEDYQAYIEARVNAAEALEEQEFSEADESAEDEAGEDASAEESGEEVEAEAAHAEAEAMASGEGQATARVHEDSRAHFHRRPDYSQRRGAGRPRRGPGHPGRGRFRGGRPHHPPRRVQQIADVLKAGQEIIVQIAKEPLGKKGARITSHVALPGRFLVYMPTVDHIGVSRKIGSAEERSRLRRLLMDFKSTYSGGFIVRTAAAGASEEEVRADVEFLTRTWSEIKGRAEQRKAPAILHRDLNLIERILRDHVTGDFTAVWIDNEEEYTKVVEFVGRFQPRLASRVKLYSKETPIFEEFSIQQEIDKSLRPKVWLKSGGYIVINHTEALVAIDVNTGKFVGKGSSRLEDTIVKTNLEAVKEIVRQIRLRDLGGIIVIDFIDMEERRNREKVMAALEEALRNDKAPSKALGFNEFGLVAITRKRTKQALERVLCQPCPYCTGSGMVKSLPTICYEIQAEARKMAPELDSQSLTLRVHPEIGKALKTRESALIEELEQWTHKSVIIQSDPSLHWEQYDIY